MFRLVTKPQKSDAVLPHNFPLQCSTMNSLPNSYTKPQEFHAGTSSKSFIFATLQGISLNIVCAFIYAVLYSFLKNETAHIIPTGDTRGVE